MSRRVDRLLAALARRRVRLERRGDRLTWRAPAPVPAELLEELRALKPQVLQRLPDRNGRAVVFFRSSNSLPNAWATVVGPAGKTRAELVRDLIARWPDVTPLEAAPVTNTKCSTEE